MEFQALESQNNFDKKKNFLLKHEDFFLKEVSIWVKLSHQQLTKYKSILVWNYITSNYLIAWNIDIVDEFKKELFIADESTCHEFHYNDSLPWSIEFIERFEDLWCWEQIAQNNIIMRNSEIRNHFYNRLYPFLEQYNEDVINNPLKSEISYGDEIEDQYLSLLKNHKELQFLNPNEIENDKNIDWGRLSQNAILPWSAELIERYIDKWRWETLSINEGIPWNLELIKKFENRINWTIDDGQLNDDGSFKNGSISENQGISWDEELLTFYQNKLDWPKISLSQIAKWNIDMLIQFSERWDYDYLILNRIVWYKVFFEFNSEENLNPLLDEILEKRNNMNN